MNFSSEFFPADLFTAEQSRELDRIAIEEFKIAGIRLMKRAGKAAFTEIVERWPGAPITVFCGAGNNAGDGYIIAALAAEQGVPVNVIQVGLESKLSGDAVRACEYAKEAGVAMTPFTDSFSESLDLQTGVLVDALLGTGFSGEPRESFAQAIRIMNQSGLPVLAVDVPSGLNCDSGAASELAIQANVTVTFIGAKQGLLTGRGPALCGELVFNNLEVPDDVYTGITPSAYRLELNDLLAQLPSRQRDAHKGVFGHVMIIGGDNGYGGAVAMAAEAALRVGSGLVSVATRPEHVAGILARRPELMVRGVASGQELEPLLVNGPTVLVIGPGLGQSPWSEQMLQKAAATGLPMVVDADALNIVSQGRVITEPGGNHWVITPHPGEAARLLGVSNEQVQADRFSAVSQLQSKFNCPVVLKGAGSLVCANAKATVGICLEGNPGMASGGMGDVLSGVLGGLLAQKLTPDVALPLAVCLHATAADKAAAVAGERGLVATDLFPHLRRLVNTNE